MSATRQTPRPGAQDARGSLPVLVIGWALAGLSAGALARPAMLWLYPPWGGLAAGLIAGTLQWTSLAALPRERHPRDGLWIITTTIGYAVGSLAVGRLAEVPAGCLLMAAVGLAQCPLVLRWVRCGWLWPPASAAVGLATARIAIVAAGRLAANNMPLVAQGLAGALQGLASGAALGLTLALLFAAGRGPRPHSDDVRD